jgi:hypothetical protein
MYFNAAVDLNPVTHHSSEFYVKPTLLEVRFLSLRMIYPEKLYRRIEYYV